MHLAATRMHKEEREICRASLHGHVKATHTDSRTLWIPEVTESGNKISHDKTSVSTIHTLSLSPSLFHPLATADISSQQCGILDSSRTTELLSRDDDQHVFQMEHFKPG